MSGLQILGYSHSPIFLYECEDQSLSLRGYYLDSMWWKKSARVPIGYQVRGVGQQNSQTSLFLFWYSTCILYLSLTLRACVKFGVLGTKRTVHSTEVSILWTEIGILRSLVSVLGTKRCLYYGGRESMRFGVSRSKGTVQNAEVSVSWNYGQGLD